MKADRDTWLWRTAFMLTAVLWLVIFWMFWGVEFL
jgi:hypothetical protein